MTTVKLDLSLSLSLSLACAFLPSGKLLAQLIVYFQVYYPCNLFMKCKNIIIVSIIYCLHDKISNTHKIYNLKKKVGFTHNMLSIAE
jgi:hypothetical protein